MKSNLTDNGGEFNSDELREVQSILNIQVCTTAGESPFQMVFVSDSMQLQT